MASSSLSSLWHSIADRGREILDRRADAKAARTLEGLCHDLLSERGEASGTALARELVEIYAAMESAQKLAFFELLSTALTANTEEVLSAAEAYRAEPTAESLLALARVTEPPRQELIRRLNLAPEGTAAIVAMRQDLLGFLPKHPHLLAVDADFAHLLSSWFNRGFLVLRRIDWRTPAATLEKLFQYEAVHEIQGWTDMRRRLEEDRRCLGFFHPALPDEPLIFVEVALLEDLAGSIQPLLDTDSPTLDATRATTAIFYSINNCLDGLRGISFGSFLIKQVVSELADELPRLRSFATLSPVPGFRRWLETARRHGQHRALGADDLSVLGRLDRKGWHRDPATADRLETVLLRLCAHYLLKERESGEPLDPVARFHLGNGASIERVNWLADTSAKGMRQSLGMMVNYAYRPFRIERNHEAYVNRGRVAASSAVRALLKKPKAT